MKKILLKKMALIGPPGSGKSTFANKLGHILDIPVHHLDRHRFEPDGRKKDKHEFVEIQNAILSDSSWIIEGCSFSTFELRFSKADVFIYLRFSRFLCIWRLFKRLFNYKSAFGGLRQITWELLKYIWDFDKKKKASIEELVGKYPKTHFYVFNNQKEADIFLNSVKSSFS